MNVVKTLAIFALCLSSAMAQTRNGFDKEKDLFIAQFDNLPDNDDVHSQAAVACLLAHPDFKGVNYFCVAGAWGNQQNLRNAPNMKYIDSSELFKLAFGAEAKLDSNKKDLENARWVNAHGKFKPKSELTKERIERLEFASGVLRDRTKPILEAGGTTPRLMSSWFNIAVGMNARPQKKSWPLFEPTPSTHKSMTATKTMKQEKTEVIIRRTTTTRQPRL